MNNTFIVVDDTQFCVYLPLREFRRIDTYLVSLYPNYSRTSFSKMLERGCIMLNGEVLSRSCKVRCADVISLRLEAVNMQVDAQEIPLDIVFECSDFAIINKEAGMNVHPVPGAGGNSNTLVNALLYHFN
jgi:23S rRNA pseudouridine1911/1915/1917 synthase